MTAELEIELWWLLALPLFFFLGWIAARIDIRHLLSESRALPRSYFQGLNFLLNEQPDQAIAAFLDAARLDPETIELHFALGSLFRRRGETDRAIRVHQYLVDRDGSLPGQTRQLTDEQRLHALSELGQDYLKAGLLDRAEDIFLKLRGSARDEEALRFLLEIYQQEKEWQRCIDIALVLPDHVGHMWQKQMAHFHCELAASDLLHGQLAEADEHLQAALAVDRKCVRATLLQGELALARHDTAAAIAVWRRIEQQNPNFLALVAPKLLAAFEQEGQLESGLALLQAWLAEHPAQDLLDCVYQATLKLRGPQAALQVVRDEWRRNPSVLGLTKYYEAQLQQHVLHTGAQPSAQELEQRGDVERVHGLLYHHTRRVARYRCDSCGFKSRQYYWRCPACSGWESYSPRRIEEFDLGP